MAVTRRPRLRVVPGLLSRLDVVMGGRKLGQHSGWVLVGGVLQVPAFQDADRSHPQVFDARVETQSFVWSGLLLVIVNVCVAGVPARILKRCPSLKLNFDRLRAIGGHVHIDFRWRVLGPSLHDYLGRAPTHFNLERAIRVKEGFSRSDLENRVRWMSKNAARCKHFHASLDLLARTAIYYHAGQFSHGGFS